MFKRAWRRLFRRHKHSQRPVSPSMASWLVISRQYDAIGADIKRYPMMCEPDIHTKKTAHITRIIETKTKPLPALDCEAPTLAVPGWQFYAEDTMRMEIDEYATRPMSLAEINAIVPGIPVLR